MGRDVRTSTNSTIIKESNNLQIAEINNLIKHILLCVSYCYTYNTSTIYVIQLNILFCVSYCYTYNTSTIYIILLVITQLLYHFFYKGRIFHKESYSNIRQEVFVPIIKKLIIN